MKSYIIFSIVCMQLGWTYAGRGVATYAYQDSSGNRYGGTHDLDGAHVYPSLGKPNGGKDWDNFAHAQVYTTDHQPEGAWPNFAAYEPAFQQYDDFFPEYFNNLQNLLNEAFNTNKENQRLAYNAAKKAFDLTSNQAGYNPFFPTRFNNFDFDRFPMMNMPNGAYAGAAIRPGFSHEIAALNPENPSNPNIDIKNRFSDTASTGGGPGFYGVSSTSFSSSSSVNGQTVNHRGAETVVNNNGKISRHKVES